MDQPRYLTGQLLLAMPGMGDPRFEHAVILMAAHDEDGAIGVGIGQVRAGLTLRDLLKQLEIDPGEAPPAPIHHGGPVEPGRGFVLHSNDWSGQDTVDVAGRCALTGTQDVLRAIAEGRGPSRYIVSLGYAGWDGGQLEEELTHHGWFAAPSSEALLFDLDADARWTAAFKAQGIDPALLVGETGAA
ncbi:YqgE/AlgH family protein [Sphingomicrobium nitratireducens]|uniref:YqgE/AlgH family protein n=1 Tax=Sphingomicrobium nitratireducens TaxID=2964666 RepID=UPI00223F4C98|nr:YqgE/AlgH family protein [Sphingomicrobium nitratireducens]